MILLCFLAAIITSFGIARYNESNKLFWQTMLAFLLGYAAFVMCERTFGEDQNDGSITQVQCPTQGPAISSGSLYYLLAGDDSLTPAKVTAFKPVSQDCAPLMCDIEAILSKVFGRTRDQPRSINTQPPERSVEFFNTS